MSIKDFVKKQFIDVIQWTENDDETMSWRFPMRDMEIQTGASLTVRESQLAIFVNEGRVADAFEPGVYKLTTQTLPVLTYLKNWDKLFESPFKSDVYFFSARHKIDRRWGTPSPVTIRDNEFGAVRLRAFGIYSFHIADASLFYRTLSGTLERYTVDQLEGQLRNTIVGRIAEVFGAASVPFLDMAANQESFSASLGTRVKPLFEGYGLALDSLIVQNISLPEELQTKLDGRISVNIMGGMEAYTQFQTAEAIPLAAKNEGGLAGLGAGVGAGVAIGQQMASAMTRQGSSTEPPREEDIRSSVQGHSVSTDELLGTIEKLHALAEKGIISKDEFESKKVELLKRIN